MTRAAKFRGDQIVEMQAVGKPVHQDNRRRLSALRLTELPGVEDGFAPRHLVLLEGVLLAILTVVGLIERPEILR